MTPREQWDARQELKQMAAELLELNPKCGAINVTVYAMEKAQGIDLTKEHFDTLKRRFIGHKRIYNGEI
jgi:hypothetical protein